MANFDKIQKLINEDIQKTVKAFAEFLIERSLVSKEDMDSVITEFGDGKTVRKTAAPRPKKPTVSKEKKEKVACSGVVVKTGKGCAYSGTEEIEGKWYCSTHAKKLKNSAMDMQLVRKSVSKEKTTEQKNNALDGLMQKISANKVQKNPKTGRLVHLEHKFVFDPKDTTTVIGVETSDGRLVALTETEKALCEERSWTINVGNIPERGQGEEGHEEESDSASSADEELDAGSDVDLEERED